MGKSIGIAVAGGIASAICLLSYLTGSGLALMLAYLALLPLFLVGLSTGVAAGAVAGAAGAVAVLLAGGAMAALGYLLVLGIPSAWAMRLALQSRPAPDGSVEWRGPGPILLALAGWGLAIYAVGIAVLLSEGQDPVAVLEQQMLETARAMAGGDPRPEMAAAFAGMATLIPGAVITSWLLMTVLNAAIAQTLLRRAGRNLRPSAGLGAFELPPWTAGAFALALVAAFLSPTVLGDIGATVAVVLGFAYLLAGLGVAHALTRGRPLRTLMLVLIYAAVLLLVWPAVILAGLGVIDQWAGLRRRAAGGAGPDQKE